MVIMVRVYKVDVYKRQCSDNDDKKEDTVIPAQEVAGIYNGTLSLSVSGNDQGTSDSQVKITAEEGGTVQVLLVGGAGEGMMSLPDIACLLYTSRCV